MGVSDLWPVLERVSRKHPLTYLKGKRIAVDLSVWIVQSKLCKGLNYSKNCHLKTLFYRVAHLLTNGIMPIFVMDGKAPPLKERTIIDRLLAQHGKLYIPDYNADPDKNFYVKPDRLMTEAEVRDQKPDVSDPVSDIKDPSCDDSDTKPLDGSNDESKPNSDGYFTRGHFFHLLKQCKDLLATLGVPCLQSAGEAEALCALLDLNELVDGCVTEDNDAFLYGARTVFREFNIDAKTAHVKEYTLDDIKEHLQLDREKLVALALLLGCDYVKGLPRIGKETALRLLEDLPGVDLLERFKDWKNKTATELFPTYDFSLEKKYICHCEVCGHPGTLLKHQRSGCEMCNSDCTCYAKQDGSTCHCAWHENLEIKIKIQNELKIFLSAQEVPDFPNQEVIDEYLNYRDEVPSKEDLEWTQPNLTGFVEGALNWLGWTVEHSLQKVSPIITSWQMTQLRNPLGAVSEVEFIYWPIRIVKTRIKRRNQCFEVQWRNRDIDNKNSDVHTVEDQQIFSEAYPHVTNEFFNNSEWKKRGQKYKETHTKLQNKYSELQTNDQNSQEVKRDISILSVKESSEVLEMPLKESSVLPEVLLNDSSKVSEIPLKESCVLPEIPLKGHHEASEMPIREWTNTSDTSLQEYYKVSEIPARECYEMPKHSMKECYEVSEMPLREQYKMEMPIRECKVLEIPLVEQYKVSEIPIREQYKVSEMPIKEQYKISEMSIRKQYKVPEMSIKEQYKVPEMSIKEQYKVPEMPLREHYEKLKGQYKMPLKEHYKAVKEDYNLAEVPLREHYGVVKEEYQVLEMPLRDHYGSVKEEYKILEMPLREPYAAGKEEYKVPEMPLREHYRASVRDWSGVSEMPLREHYEVSQMEFKEHYKIAEMAAKNWSGLSQIPLRECYKTEIPVKEWPGISQTQLRECPKGSKMPVTEWSGMPQVLKEYYQAPEMPLRKWSNISEIPLGQHCEESELPLGKHYEVLERPVRGSSEILQMTSREIPAENHEIKVGLEKIAIERIIKSDKLVNKKKAENLEKTINSVFNSISDDDFDFLDIPLSQRIKIPSCYYSTAPVQNKNPVSLYDKENLVPSNKHLLCHVKPKTDGIKSHLSTRQNCSDSFTNGNKKLSNSKEKKCVLTNVLNIGVNGKNVSQTVFPTLCSTVTSKEDYNVKALKSNSYILSDTDKITLDLEELCLEDNLSLELDGSKDLFPFIDEQNSNSVYLN